MKAINRWITVVMLFLWIESSSGVKFESLGKAIAKVIGTKKALKKVVKVEGQEVSVFYPKSGKRKSLAVVQKRIYETGECTHTWVIGVNARTAKVEDVRVVEMKCPHAFPCKESSFTSQFKGMGPAQLKKLKNNKIQAIAKATGSSELTADAVRVAILSAKKLKGKL